MQSIQESSYKILADLISRYDLSDLFELQKKKIICLETGSEFNFEGLFRNVDKIKSYYSIDYCWIAEAQPVSEDSLQMLLPTIRNPDSEIWIDFNQKYADDPVYKRFVVSPPSNAIVKHVTWRDNPWFPEVLREEMANDFKYRPQAAKNIWEGELCGTGGLVWEGFDPKTHVKELPKEVIGKSNVYMGLDPHSAHYSAAVWIAVYPDPADSKRLIRYVFAEWPRISTLNGPYAEVRKSLPYGGTYSDMAREFYATESSHLVKRVYGRYIDSRFAIGSGAGNWSNKTDGIVSEFAKRENGGVLFECPALTMIDSRKDVIKKDMEYNTMLPISDLNTPHFFVHPSCINTIASLSNHRYEESSEAEDDRYSDFSDSLRICYAGFGDRRWIDPEKKAFIFEDLDENNSGTDWMLM